jgi:mono/diheme cytochrome c family protein
LCHGAGAALARGLHYRVDMAMSRMCRDASRAAVRLRGENRARGPVLAALALLATARPADAALAVGAEIEIWVRGDAKPDRDAPERVRSRRYRLDRLPLVEGERRDVQYGDARRYRGIGVRAVLDRYAPDRGMDLAILHFANGMAVPLPFRDTAAMQRLDPFIARAWRPSRDARLGAGVFPPLIHRDASGDRRPIEFGGNKLVVAEPWHPDVPAGEHRTFSPWAHADTLTGIELVVARTYFAQFDAGGDATVQRGLTLFRESCQFCHGARSVGARFGWDLVDSPVILGHRESAAHLYHNVALKPRNAGQLGLMMPALAFLAESDAAALREWLVALAGRPTDGGSP